MLPPDCDAPATARPAARREDERLIVRVGPERFALPLTSVLEALVAPAVHEVPALPEGCLGLLAWRGRRLRVHCPCTPLGQRAARPASAVLVLGTERGAVAVAVDEVLDVQSAPPECVRALPGLRDPFRVVRGVIVDADGIVVDVAPGALAAALELGRPAEEVA